MQLLLEFLPLVAFFIVYKFPGAFGVPVEERMYVATATLMVGMALSLLVLWIRARRLPAMFALSTGLVVVFGVMTLWLRNAHFIQWKPTILLWLTSVAFLLSVFIGQKPLVQRMMEPALGEGIQLGRSDWLKLNTGWVLYGLVVGAINLALIYSVSEDTWVNVKIPLLSGSLLLFVVGQFLWLQFSGKLKS
jgi:intracellular septation protein